VDADAGDVLFFHCCSLHGSKAKESESSRGTVLIQLYSGKDKVEYSTHANVQLTNLARVESLRVQ
jgi:ectoine hydroxylase-related dioxygenase (phytanoyl-CoA dioxygenase family)